MSRTENFYFSVSYMYDVMDWQMLNYLIN